MVQKTKHFYHENSGKIKLGFVLIGTVVFSSLLVLAYTNLFSPPAPKVPEAQAAVGNIGIWRDSAGGQIPGTTFAAFNFATQERNDGTYTFSASNNLNLDEAGNYLLIATLKLDDSSAARVNYEGRFTYTGSGNFVTLYGTGYDRDAANRTSWVRVVGLVWGAAANDDVQLEMRTDTDTPLGGSIANASHFQVVRLHDSAAVGLYTDTADTAAYGTQTWTDAPYNNIVLENDTAVIQRQGGNVNFRLKKDATTFLIGYGLAFGTAIDRTQRVTKMVAGASDITNSFSYVYQRQASDEYADPNGLFLYRNSGTATDLSVQAQRGNADVAGSAVRRTSTSGMFIVELPSGAESFISHDATGGQDVSGVGSLGNFNAMAVVDHNDAAGFTKVDNATMNVEKAMDVLLMGQAYIERSGISSVRMTVGTRFEIQGTDQTLGEHGNYLRGDQATTDTNNSAFYPVGMYAVSLGDDVQMEFFDAGDDGATDNSQANAVGFSALNLDSLAGVGDDVTVGTLGTQTASMTIPSTVNYVGGAFKIVDSAGSRNVTGITITENGTVDGLNNLDNIKLQYDLDTTTPYDCASESYAAGDTQFGSTDTTGFSAANGTSAFTGTVAISTTQTMCVYVVLDVLSGAAATDNLEIQIADPSANVTISAGTIGPSSAVAISGTTELDPLPNVDQIHFRWRNDDGTE